MTDQKQVEEELVLIKKIMEDSRNAVYDSGTQGIFWSILIAITLIINYVILLTGNWLQYMGLVWLVMMLLGTIVSIFLARKEKKTVRVSTFAGKVLTSIWISIGISNSIIAFASVIAKAFDPLYIIPIDSIILGLGFYVTAYIVQLRYLKYISLLWWVGGVLFLAFPSFHSILFLSLMLIISILFPAIENRSKWKAQLEQA